MNTFRVKTVATKNAVVKHAKFQIIKECVIRVNESCDKLAINSQLAKNVMEVSILEELKNGFEDRKNWCFEHNVEVL